MVAGIHEELTVAPELVAGVTMVALHGLVLDGAVHAFNLPIDPRVVVHGWFALVRRCSCSSQTRSTMCCISRMSCLRGELDAAVGRNCIDAARQAWTSSRRNPAASILPARSTKRTQANLLVRSMAMKSRKLPTTL